MVTPGVTIVSMQPCNSHAHPQPTGQLILRTKAPQIQLSYTHTLPSLEKHILFVYDLDRKAPIPMRQARQLVGYRHIHKARGHLFDSPLELQ
jgi:hypothetical protein